MYEEKKKFLSRYLLQEAKINRLQRMILKNPKDKETYIKKIAECNNIRNEIEEKIKLVNDEVLVELLYQKYIFGQNLEETGYIINYSKRQTERLHRKALEMFKI